MIEDKDLRSLVEFSGGKVLSVYLDTDLADKSKDAVNLMFRDRVRRLEGVPPRETEAMQTFLNFEYDWQSRGLALFSSGEALWKVVPLPIPVRSQAFFAGRPYVRVLTDVLDRFARYDVALIDRESIKLFSVEWGKIRSETEAFGEQVRRYKEGGWSSTGHQRSSAGSQRAGDNLALRNLKQAVEVIRTFYQQTKSKRLMLGGSPEVLSQIKDMLPRHLRDRVIGQFVVDVEASPNEVLSRSLDIAAQVDLKEEQDLVAEAITSAAKGKMGVTGLADTLYALHQGQVRLLLVEESYRASGYICANCGYVASEHNEECPFCKHNRVNETPDVVNLAIHKAVETGAGVNIVRQNEKLSQVGGIAGILRY